MKFLRFICFVAVFLCFVYLPVGAESDLCRYTNVLDVYNAADIVVVGKAVGKAENGYDLLFQVARVIKGTVKSEIVLRGQRPVNTEANGFDFVHDTDILLLLHKTEKNLYDSVEDYNSSCFVLYFVVDETVILDSRIVELDAINDYFVATSSISY